MNRADQPMVSVIMPAYNAADFIDEALQSVLDQNYQPLEILVVDDGSSDDTPAVAARYGDKIRYIRQDNAGPGAARNRGLDLARGELIAFLDSDDTWLAGKLARQTALMSADPDIGLSFHDFYFEREPQEPPVLAFSLAPQLYEQQRNERADRSYVFSQSMFEPLLLRNYIGTSTVMIRKNCISQVGPFDASFPSAQDRELWLRIAKKYRLGFIDAPLTRYRYNPHSITRNSEKRCINIIRLLERHRVDAGPETQKLVGAQLAEIRQDLAYLYFEQGRMTPARQAYLQALKHHGGSKNAAYLAATFIPQTLIAMVRKIKGWKKR
jgi:glycosyltransferase involved in cell wall biosynthesis